MNLLVLSECLEVYSGKCCISETAGAVWCRRCWVSLDGDWEDWEVFQGSISSMQACIMGIIVSPSFYIAPLHCTQWHHASINVTLAHELQSRSFPLTVQMWRPSDPWGKWWRYHRRSTRRQSYGVQFKQGLPINWLVCPQACCQLSIGFCPCQYSYWLDHPLDRIWSCDVGCHTRAKVLDNRIIATGSMGLWWIGSASDSKFSSVEFFSYVGRTWLRT